MLPSWPDLPYAQWRDTCSALHLYSQIIGKYRLAQTPWVNHSWHATLYLNGRGLTTSLIHDGERGVEIALDLIDHRVVGTSTDGRLDRFSLGPMAVADFYARFVKMLERLGASPALHNRPNEVPHAVRFADDAKERPYDGKAVQNYLQTLLRVHRVFSHFRTGFLGKVSPVHLFWGSFDLAVTRFSGRVAPLHPGGIANLPDEVTQEAYSHEVSSAGFWPGGAGLDEAGFFAYAYPEPSGFAEASVMPEAALYSKNLGEFVLPYEAVRQADDADATLMAFLQSTYEAAASLGHWNRTALECPLGELGKPRLLQADAQRI